MSSLASANQRGIACMVGAMACFLVNDALVKLASQNMPGAQLIFLRGAMAFLLILAVARSLGVTSRIAEVRRGWPAARAVVDAVGTLFYLGSLFHLPIANAAAITLAAPLLMTVYAALFMHEQVRIARWLAVIVGFAGVLLVIQPRTDGFNGWALICLAATFLHAARDLITRQIAASVPSILVTLGTSIAVMGLAGLLSLAQGWQAFGWMQFALLALASVFLAGGYFLIISSMRQGELTLVAPFRYSGILFALLLGYGIWGDVPNTLAWWGIALLVASGLYVTLSERRRSAVPGMTQPRSKG